MAELLSEVERLKREIVRLKGLSVCELGSENQSVSDYMNHWERRVEQAEARIAEDADAQNELRDILQTTAPTWRAIVNSALELRRLWVLEGVKVKELERQVEDFECSDVAKMRTEIHDLKIARDAAQEALKVIYKTVRGDEKSECWTIRKWLDERDIFNDDLSGSERLIEAVCKAALAQTAGKGE